MGGMSFTFPVAMFVGSITMGLGIEKVTTIPELEEFMIRRPCIYGLSTEMLRQCWIGYAGRPAGYCAVTSSDIIVAAQETGEVVFCGSAGDEGCM